MYDSHVKAYRYNKFEQAGGFGMVGGILGAISNSILGGINAHQQQKWNKQQQENWNKQFEYTKWLNQVQMQREDTAVQRRAADLQAAGMNRLMAAGDGAEAGTLTSFQGNAGGSAPQIDINPIEAYLNAKQSQANIANTEAQTQLIRNKAESEKAGLNLKGAQKGYYDVLTANGKYEGYKAMYSALREMNDYNIESTGGLKSNDSSRANNMFSAIDTLLRIAANKLGIDIWGSPKKEENKEAIEKVAEEAIKNGQLTTKDWAEKWKEISKMKNMAEAWREFGKSIIWGPK